MVGNGSGHLHVSNNSKSSNYNTIGVIVSTNLFIHTGTIQIFYVPEIIFREVSGDFISMTSFLSRKEEEVGNKRCGN